MHPFIIPLLASEKYINYSFYLPYFIAAASLFAAGEIYAIKMQAKMLSLRLSYIKLFMGFLGIGMNFIGAYYMGIGGVVASLLLFCTINFFVMRIGSND
jgi:O-antigen/teichoic acid export membrane protein